MPGRGRGKNPFLGRLEREATLSLDLLEQSSHICNPRRLGPYFCSFSYAFHSLAFLNQNNRSDGQEVAHVTATSQPRESPVLSSVFRSMVASFGLK